MSRTAEQLGVLKKHVFSHSQFLMYSRHRKQMIYVANKFVNENAPLQHTMAQFC